MYQAFSEDQELNNDVENNNQRAWTKDGLADGPADPNDEKGPTNVYNGETTADGVFAGKDTKQTLPPSNESRFSHIKDGLETSVSVEGKERIDRIVSEVNSLSDVEKLLLYLKLPTGAASEDQTRQTPTSFLHSSNRIEQAHAFTWIRSHLEEDAEICVPKHEVFDDYRLYCESHTLKPLCPADFGKVMKCVFPNVKPRRLGQRGQSNGLRKKLEVQPPSLPELEVSPKRESIEYSEENELNVASRQLVCEWAQKLLGRSFGQLQELAEFLVGNLYVNSKSTAAFTVLAAMQEAGLQNSKVPVSSLFTSSSGGNKHKEMQLQLQRKLAERELIKEQKKKLQQHRSELEQENEKLRSEGFLTPSPAFQSPVKYAARNITKLLQSPVSHSQSRRIPESPKLLKSPMSFLQTSEARTLVTQSVMSNEVSKKMNQSPVLFTTTQSESVCSSSRNDVVVVQSSVGDGGDDVTSAGRDTPKETVENVRKTRPDAMETDTTVSHSVVTQILLNNVKLNFDDRNSNEVFSVSESGNKQSGEHQTVKSTEVQTVKTSEVQNSARTEKIHIVRKPSVKPFSSSITCPALSQGGNLMQADGKRKAVHTSMLNVSLSESSKLESSKNSNENTNQVPASCGTLPSAFCSAFVPVTNSRKETNSDSSPQRTSTSAEESDGEGNQMQVDSSDQCRDNNDDDKKSVTAGDGPVLASPQTTKRARCRFAPIRPKVSPIKTISSILKEAKGVENQGPAYDSRPVSAILKERRAKEAQDLLAQIASNVQAGRTSTPPKQIHTEIINLPITPSKGLSSIPADLIKLPVAANSGTNTSDVFLIVNTPNSGSVPNQPVSRVSNAQTVISSSSLSSSYQQLAPTSLVSVHVGSQKNTNSLSCSQAECVDRSTTVNHEDLETCHSLSGSVIFTSASLSQTKQKDMSLCLSSSSSTTTSVILTSALSHSIQKDLPSTIESFANVVNSQHPATVFITSSPMQQGPSESQTNLSASSSISSTSTSSAASAVCHSETEMGSSSPLHNSSLTFTKNVYDSNMRERCSPRHELIRNEHLKKFRVVFSSCSDLSSVRDNTDITGRKRKSSAQETENHSSKKLNSSEVRLEDDDVFVLPLASSKETTDQRIHSCYSDFNNSLADMKNFQLSTQGRVTQSVADHRDMNTSVTNVSSLLRQAKKQTSGDVGEQRKDLNRQSVKISGGKLSLESLENDALLDSSPSLVDQDLVTSLGSKSAQTASVGVNAKSLNATQKQLMHQKMKLDQQFNHFLNKAKSSDASSDMKQIDKAKAKQLLRILQQTQLQRQARCLPSASSQPVNLLSLLQAGNMKQLQQHHSQEQQQHHHQEQQEHHHHEEQQQQKKHQQQQQPQQQQKQQQLSNKTERVDKDQNQNSLDLQSRLFVDNSQQDLFFLDQPKKDAAQSHDAQRESILNSELPSEVADFITEHSQFQPKMSDISPSEFHMFHLEPEPFTIPEAPSVRSRQHSEVKNRYVPMQRSLSMPMFAPTLVQPSAPAPTSVKSSELSARFPAQNQKQNSLERLNSETSLSDGGYGSFEASPLTNLTPCSSVSTEDDFITSYTLRSDIGFSNTQSHVPQQSVNSISVSSSDQSSLGSFISPSAFMPIQGGVVNGSKTHRVTLIKPTVTAACSSPTGQNTSAAADVSHCSVNGNSAVVTVSAGECNKRDGRSEVVCSTTVSHSEASVKRTGVLKQLLGRKDSLPSYEEALHHLGKCHDGQGVNAGNKSEKQADLSSRLVTILSSSNTNGVQDIKTSCISNQPSFSLAQKLYKNHQTDVETATLPVPVITTTTPTTPSTKQFAPPSPYTSNVPPASPHNVAMVTRTLSMPPSSPGSHHSAAIAASPHGPHSAPPPASPYGPPSVPPASPHGPRSVPPPASPHGPRSVPAVTSPRDSHSVPPASPNSTILSPKVYPIGLPTASPQASRPGSRQSQVFVSGQMSAASPCGSQPAASPGSQSLVIQPASPYEATPSAILTYGLKQPSNKETKQPVLKAGLEMGSVPDSSKSAAATGDSIMTKEFPFSFHLALLSEKALTEPAELKPDQQEASLNRKTSLVKSELCDAPSCVSVPMDESSNLIMSHTKLSDVSFVFSTNETSMELSSVKQSYASLSDTTTKQSLKTNVPASQSPRTSYADKSNPVGSAPLLAGLLNSNSDEESDKLRIVQSRSSTSYSKREVPSALLNALGNSHHKSAQDLRSNKTKTSENFNSSSDPHDSSRHNKTTPLNIQIPDPRQQKLLKGLPVNVPSENKSSFIAFNLPNVNYMGRAPNIDLATILPQKPVERKQTANPGNIDFSSIFPSNSVPKTSQILNSAAKTKLASNSYIGSHSEVNPPNVNLEALLNDHDRPDGISHSDLRHLLAGQNSSKLKRNRNQNSVLQSHHHHLLSSSSSSSSSSCVRNDSRPSASANMIFTSAPLHQNSTPTNTTTTTTTSTTTETHKQFYNKPDSSRRLPSHPPCSGASINSENPLLSNLLSKQPTNTQSYTQLQSAEQNTDLGPENGTEFVSPNFDELGCTLDVLKMLDSQYFDLDSDSVQSSVTAAQIPDSSHSVLVADDSS